jgi:hypothetical protein
VKATCCIFHREFCSQYRIPEDAAEVVVKNTVKPLFKELLED